MSTPEKRKPAAPEPEPETPAIDTAEPPNAALAPVPDEEAARTWKVLAGRVHDTNPGGTFTAALTPQIALLVEGGHITETTDEKG